MGNISSHSDDLDNYNYIRNIVMRWSKGDIGDQSIYDTFYDMIVRDSNDAVIFLDMILSPRLASRERTSLIERLVRQYLISHRRDNISLVAIVDASKEKGDMVKLTSFVADEIIQLAHEYRYNKKNLVETLKKLRDLDLEFPLLISTLKERLHGDETCHLIRDILYDIQGHVYVDRLNICS